MQAYAPELDRRIRKKLKPTTGYWHVDETYIRVKGVWTYLYRAVDASGQTVDFLLSAHRDSLSAKRFFEKALRSPHNGYPEALIVDRNPAYPAALSLLKREGHLGEETILTTGRWLNNRVEQDHRRIKRLVRPGLGFKEFHSAGRTIQGYEAMSMVWKGQVDGVSRGSRETASVLVEAIFGVGA